MKKYLALGMVGVFALGLFALVPDALATSNDILGLNYGSATGLGNTDVRLQVANIIRVALSLLGILTVVIIIWAGFEWMTAGGNEDQVSSAKKRLSAAVIGLAIVLSAYAITNFVVKNLYQATTGQNYQTGQQQNP